MRHSVQTAIWSELKRVSSHFVVGVAQASRQSSSADWTLSGISQFVPSATDTGRHWCRLQWHLDVMRPFQRDVVSWNRNHIWAHVLQSSFSLRAFIDTFCCMSAWSYLWISVFNDKSWNRGTLLYVTTITCIRSACQNSRKEVSSAFKKCWIISYLLKDSCCVMWWNFLTTFFVVVDCILIWSY